MIAGNGLGTVNGANVHMLQSSGSAIQSNIIGTDITGTIALSITTYFGVCARVRVVHHWWTYYDAGHGIGQPDLGQQRRRHCGCQPDTSRDRRHRRQYHRRDLSGEHAVPNRNWGVVLSDVSQVTIGGNCGRAANLISGNAVIGVYIDGSTATANLVAGNYIGTDIAGKLAVANLQGVLIADGALNNTIGGPQTTPGTGAGNVISGNTDCGVVMTVANTNVGANGNLVEGNLIGTDVQGTVLQRSTAWLGRRAPPATPLAAQSPAAGNAISGNAHDGIEIRRYRHDGEHDRWRFHRYKRCRHRPRLPTAPVRSSPPTAIAASSSAAALPAILSAESPQCRNLVSGNSAYGISIDANSIANVVEGNYVGTDYTGNAARR